MDAEDVTGIDRLALDGVTWFPPNAATVRAGVERGDPLVLRDLLVMGAKIEARRGVTTVTLSTEAARAHGLVGDDARYPAVQFPVIVADADGQDGAAMEHGESVGSDAMWDAVRRLAERAEELRRRRLASYQALR